MGQRAASCHGVKISGFSGREGSGSLRIAVDRLAWLGTRSDALDVLVKTDIATEALFRSGEPRKLKSRKGEGTHARIARRAADVVDGTDFSMNADDVREFFHEAYEMRNNAAHCGERSDKVMVGKDLVPFVEFVDRYPTLMRRALLRHLSACTGPALPTWLERSATPSDPPFDLNIN